MSLGAADTSTETLGVIIRQAYDLGGKPMVRVLEGIADTHGVPVAVAWITALSADPRTRELYAERKRLADSSRAGAQVAGGVLTAARVVGGAISPVAPMIMPSGSAWRSATGSTESQDIARKVEALEQQVLASVLRQMKRSTRASASPRQAQGVGVATRVPDNIGYRDVPGAGGYVYRQYADGTLVLVQSPKGGAGKTVDPRSAAGRAIVQEIGSFPASGASTPESVTKALQAANQVIDLLPKGRGGRPSKAADAAKIGVGAAGTAIALQPVVAPVIGGLFAAAGVSASVPVAGWIVAGGLALAGATVALVNLFRKKHPRREIDAHVKRHRLPPESPQLLDRFARMSSEQRNRLGHQLAERLRSGRAKNPALAKAQLAALSAVELAQRAAARGQAHALDRFEQQVGALMGIDLGRSGGGRRGGRSGSSSRSSSGRASFATSPSTRSSFPTGLPTGRGVFATSPASRPSGLPAASALVTAGPPTMATLTVAAPSTSATAAASSGTDGGSDSAFAPYPEDFIEDGEPVENLGELGRPMWRPPRPGPHRGPRVPRGPWGPRRGPWLHPAYAVAPIFLAPPAPVDLPCAPGPIRDAFVAAARSRGIPVASVTCRQMPDGAQVLVAHVPEDIGLDLPETSFRGWRVIYALNAPARGAVAAPLPTVREVQLRPVEVALGRAPFVLG